MYKSKWLHTQDKLEVFWKLDSNNFPLTTPALNQKTLKLYLLFLW